MFKRIVLLFVVVVLIGGCKKYPEDTLLVHIRTPYKRLTRCGWTIKSYERLTSTPWLPDCNNIEPTFYTNGTSTGGCASLFITTAPGNITSYNYYFKGTWELINNDNCIKVTNDATHSTIWTILELDNNKMKIKSDSVQLYLEM